MRGRRTKVRHTANLVRHEAYQMRGINYAAGLPGRSFEILYAAPDDMQRCALYPLRLRRLNEFPQKRNFSISEWLYNSPANI